ncbi:hypothetical protein BO83DRAFT_442602 [Aspergillus eucalypticola CBS 122712]|uniref:Uncharacterized protein n=1 Tax=Aspergillus eucalypticola (strain CBS 122712 / IBT 29274) TaxID=1448314 RepID=A0A317WLR2_ASPEC|nr:uncharacterized protein BO83DRAFT_442602 [Aspergillus eucalypticola CBS 122712]PWY85170.1 hypothetical protein BO83DRAFT_442602 [Aspergillus eucalypticola CBS 122712]
MPTQKCSKRRHTEDDSSHCSLGTSVLLYKTPIWRPFRVILARGSIATAVKGLVCLRGGFGAYLTPSWYRGRLRSLYQDWCHIHVPSLASEFQRRSGANSTFVGCGLWVCFKAVFAVNQSKSHYPGPRRGMPGAMPAAHSQWCHGMMPNKAFDMLAGVEGDLTAHSAKAGPARNSVLLKEARKDRPVRQTKLPSFEAYLRERLADGFWYAMKAAVSSPDDDRLCLTHSTGIHEYAIDSACAFNTLGHARALQEDSLYGACSYDRQPFDQLPDSRSDSYDDIIFAAGYLSLESYVWGANAHLDLLRGQVNQTSATPLPEHWYARVWHDALFGQSTPGELYKWTARTKDHGSFTGDREFTEC